MNELISNRIINVSFKGDRNYVYASDLFKLVIEEVQNHGIQKIKNIDYSVHSLLNRKVSFSLYSLDENETIDEPAGVRINFNSNGLKFVGLLNENDLIISEKTIYDENDIFKNSLINQNDSSIELNKSYSKYSNLDVFTSMNKMLLTEIRPDIKGKWVSVRLQLNKLSDLVEDRNQYKVKLMKVFSNKYTRSDLYNSNQKIGSLYFSII